MTTAEQAGTKTTAPAERLSEDMVRQVAELVYAKWQKEMKIERERRQFRTSGCYGRRTGGR